MSGAGGILNAPEVSAADVVDLDATLAELAKLSPIEYDRRRDEAAKLLKVRVSTLDAEVERRRPKDSTPEEGAGCRVSCEDPEPWDDPVDGETLANELVSIFLRFLVLLDEVAEVLTLWVLHSHAHDGAFVSPILAVTSPEKRCGKTTLLSLLQALVRRPLPTSNATASTIFRAVEKWRPTLLIDEADTFLRDSEELRGILNSGHTRSQAFVLRNVEVGGDYEPRAFSTWAPKAVALIGKMHPTLMDRSVVASMRRKRPDEKVEGLRLDRLDELADLPRRLARWSDDHMGQLRTADPEVPPGMNDRAADNWRPLLAIADTIGGSWPKKARDALAMLTACDDGDEAVGVMLLEDIRALFKSVGKDRLPSADIVTALGKKEHRPWPEWKNEKLLTTRQLAGLLKPFGIHPGSKRDGEETFKGYLLADFRDAFERYIPPVPPDTLLLDPSQRHSAELARKNSDTDPSQASGGVTDRGNGKSARGARCDGVTDLKGGGYGLQEELF